MQHCALFSELSDDDTSLFDAMMVVLLSKDCSGLISNSIILSNSEALTSHRRLMASASAQGDSTIILLLGSIS